MLIVQHYDSSFMELERILETIEGYREEMVETLVEFCRIPALGPTSGGDGELEKAKWLQHKLESFGFYVERCDGKDQRVSTGIRPNLIVNWGEGNNRLWIFSHIDIVPPGDLKKWSHNPFDPVVKDGKIFGRGVEDNGQACIASLFALKALKEFEIKTRRPLSCTWVSDEETGSYYGVQHILREGLVKKGDWVLAPDRGNPKGNQIEIAEKNILWLKFTIFGKQAHGSTPHKGNNAHRTGADLIVHLDRILHQKFKAKDTLFDPPVSTFEPTMKEANVPNVNTIPGEDVFYFDCRLLPQYKNKDVLAIVREQVRTMQKKYRVKISLEIPQNESSPSTSADSPVVEALSKAIVKVRKVKPRVRGVGGGTVAAYFRRKGIDSVVWETNEETAHTINEYITNSNNEEIACNTITFPSSFYF